MSKIPALVLYNGVAAERASVPRLTVEELARFVIGARKRGRRVAALFGTPLSAGAATTELLAVLANDDAGELEIAACGVDGSYPSMTPQCAEVHLFERELAEQWGVVPRGHPWLKPVRYHKSYRSGRDAWGRADDAVMVAGAGDFYRVEGEEVHEVAVGPVHAGVIEPGHFRFQCHGEDVFHLEIALGFQHRGVERALVGGPDKRSVQLMETLAGDTTVGHTTAYCQVLEGLGGAPVSARGAALRGVALELERLANHTGDLGALANDVGFLPAASYCGRLRGDFLNLTALLCGSRFGRGFVRPGGAAFDVDAARIMELQTRLDAAYRDVENAVELLWHAGSVQARFEDTGRVDVETARLLGLVGVAARASGLRRDVRKTHPLGIYQFAYLPIATWDSGDVFARAFVRWHEIRESVAFLRQLITRLPAGPSKVIRSGRGVAQLDQPTLLRPDHVCVALVEGWRGEICHVATTDVQGRFAHYKVVDPSFHNWTGLAMALREQQISDFPLCNKSFNLSYCGHDL